MKNKPSPDRQKTGTKSEQGIALLLTLGILGLLMVMAMSFAYTARLETMASEVNTDMIRARMMAQSGLERVTAFMRNATSDSFYTPSAGDWIGRSLIVSISSDNNDIQDALAVSFGGPEFTPSAPILWTDDTTELGGWLDLNSSMHINGVEEDVIIGRMAYLIIDDTGKLDPSGVVCLTSDESTGQAKLGASETEIAMADLGFTAIFADKFRSKLALDPADGVTPDPGEMPGNGRWTSISHMARALAPDATQMQTIVRQLRPHSVEPEQFWDATATAYQNRANLAETSLTATDVYAHLQTGNWLANAWNLGGNYSLSNIVKHSGTYYYCISPHISTASDEPGTGASWATYWKLDADARKKAAAQVTANIMDYTDADSLPRTYWIDNGDALVSTDPGFGSYKYKVQGVEDTWGLSELAMHLEITPDASTTDLSVRVGFKCDIFYPFDIDEVFSGSLTISYTTTLNGTVGADVTDPSSGTYSVTINPADLTLTNLDGGTLRHTAAYKYGALNTVSGVLALEGDIYTVPDVRIVSVTLTNGSGTVNSFPFNATGVDNTFFSNWMSPAGSTYTVTTNLYAKLQAVDPLQNHRDDQDADFGLFWLGDSIDLTTVDSSAATIGALTVSGVSNTGYNSSDYSGIEVKNAPFERLGELGRVHSYQPMRSLRLWSQEQADQVGHDAHLLDIFKIGAQEFRFGRVNVNGVTKDNTVLSALSTNVFTTAATAGSIIVANQPYANLGEFFGGRSGATTQDLYVSASTYTKDQDKQAEEQIVQRLAELVSTRYNYFTVIVCAQAIQDIGPVSPAVITIDGVSCQLNRYDHDGDKILAEHKLLAILRRDANTNEISIIHTEVLYE